MSLKDIGKFHKDVSLINSISDGLDFSDNNEYNKAFNSIRDSLEGLNIDDAAKKLRSLKINPDLAVDLLNDAKKADLLIGSTDEIADGIKKVSSSSKNVSGLKDAFHGLFNVVKANPFKTAALAATAVGVGVYTYYKKQKEELIKSANEVTSAWKESTDNLDSQMAQYKSLKEKLDSGTLSSSEEISVKQQILDIQNQIVSQYGEQASGINLVNGELGTQLALMQQISSENAKTTLNKSRKEYADAKNEMTKTRRYNLGNFNEKDLTKSTYNSIKSLAKEFEKYGVYLGETGGSVYLSFEGDATQANEVVDNFMKRLSTIQSELDSGSSDYNIVDKILNDSSTSLSKNQKVLDNYQESYKTFLQMDMMSQGTGEGSIGKVFNDYTKSVEKYNNALSSGDTTKIKEARREFSSMSQTVQDALAMDGNKNFKLLFDDVEEQLNKSAAKAEDFKQILSGDSSKSNQFKDIAKDATTASEEIKKLKLDSADVKNALMTNGIQDGESSILKLSTAWGITADSSEEEIQSFIDVLVNAGIVSDGVAQGISQNSELISESFSQFKTSAIDAINSVDALNAALANSVSGKGLSVGIDESGNLTGDLADVISMYGDLEGYDPSIVFERTANGIHLNREALRQLQAQQEALQKQDFINQQTELQKRLNEAIAEQQKYQKGTEEYDSAGAVVSDLQSQLQTVQLLASAYDGATSAYQKWLNAQSNGEEGDMYRNVSKTMKERGDELYKEGRYNTEEFRAIADFYSNEDLTNASMEKVVQAYEAAAQARERYFTGDKQGIDNFMYDLQNNAELVSQGVVKTLEDGTIEFSANSDKILAEQFNLSEEAIQSILRAAEEYNDKIKLGDLDSGNLNEKLAEATAKAEEAKEKLKELKEAGSESLNIDFNFDSTDINDLNNQINSAKENLNQFKNSDGVVDLSIDGADEAVTILSALIQQKQQVENPAIMSIDTTGLDEGVSDVISKLQEYQTAVNELNHLEELQAAGITVDTSELDEAKKKVDDTFAEIQGMSENGNLDINADVSVNASSKEKLNADLKSMTPEITAKIVPDKSSLNAESGNAVVNYKKGNQEKPDNRNAKVNYKLGDQEKPKKKTAKVDYKLGSQSPPKTPKTATVNYVLGTQASPKEKTVKVHYDTSGAPTSGKGGGKSADLNGTFHAYANGSNVSLNKNQSALVNELGMESVVRDGKWMMIPGGAHIEQFKKGDIIFNTEQTKDLIEHGYITGSNKKGRMAFADGTAHATLNAYSGGSWVFGDTGNGNLGGTSYSPAPRKSSSKSSSKSTSTSNAEKAAKDALDAISGYFDWVKVRFDRLARETELAENAIENAVGLFEKQSATSKTIEKVQAEINAAKAGADRYLSHANWYAGKSGLSADIQNQVKSGTIDISKYDEDTQKKISEYQSWYENYLDALDKVIDLQKKENELAQQRLENIEDFYELVNNVHSSLTDAIDASLELEEMKGFSGVSDSVKQAIQKQIQAAEEVYNQTAKQLADYQAEFNDLVSKGYIKEGSDAWYEGQAKLNEFNKALSEAEMSIIEFDDKLREIEYTKIQNIIDGFDRAVSKLDKKIELMEARDEKIPESLYQEQINTNDSQIIANKQLRDKKLAEMSLYDVNSKRYQELAEEINKLDEETLQLMTDNEKLKDSIFELRFSDLDEAIENYNKLGNEIEDFLGLLNEEAYFDKTGKGTSELASALALMQQGMIASKQKVSDLQKGLEKLQESFDNGVISEKEYNEKSEEYREGIRDAIATTEKYKDTINDLYMTQMNKEASATTELIDKYDEARKRKESYFEYDRKLKNQQKSVNLIKAQIAALESVNNATAQAEKRRLEAELAQQQESLDDLKRDHKNEMMDLGSEKFKEDINDWLEDTEYEIAHSAQKQEEVISSMLDRVVGNYKDAFDKINQIIGNTGWVGSNGFNQNQSQLGSQSGAQSQHESATKPQGSIKPSGNASGTVTTPIPNNGDFNSKFENEIMQKPNTDNRLCAELKLSTTAISIQEEQTAHVTAQIRPTDAKNKTLTWNSSDVRIATASNGTISGLKPGSCQVTVITTDGSGLSASIGVTVTKKPEPPKPAPPANNNNTGADGVPKVGDAVTFASGFYYYDSQGVTPSGGQMRGQTVYITKINSRSWATKPYHISRTSKFGEHDLGWVSLDQLRGYRSGASFIPENQLAITQEDGKEFILRNGSVLTQLNEGDKIMTRQETDNMYNWSKINPGQFAFSPTYDPVPNITPVNNTVIENHYDSLLTIDGGTITKDSIPDMKKLLMDSYKFTSSMMYKDAKKTGLRKR